MVRHVKLPDHLHISPPQSPTTPTSNSYLKPSTYVASVGLLNETSSSALAVGDRIPGFKTSAGGCVHPLVARDQLGDLSLSFHICLSNEQRRIDVVHICSLPQLAPRQPQLGR